MKQIVFEWVADTNKPLPPLCKFLQDRIKDGFCIKQVIPGGYVGRGASKVINNAIIICEKLNNQE